MKVEELSDGKREFRVLAGMTRSDEALAKLASLSEREFASPAAQTIASLCCKYYERYGKAPNGQLEGMIAAWAGKGGREEDEVRSLERFAARLGEQTGEVDAALVVDEARDLFNANRANRTIEEAKALLERGESGKALRCLAEVSPSQLDASPVRFGLTRAAIRKSHTEDAEPIVRYPGALGEFFGPALARRKFISFMAPTGGTKSFWLMDLAWRAMQQRRRVLYIQAGDMTDDEFMLRLQSRIVSQPQFSVNKAPPYWPCVIGRPKAVDWKTCSASRDFLTFHHPLSLRGGLEAIPNARAAIKSAKHFLVTAFYPNRAMSMTGLKAAFADAVRLGCPPDVVVIDYADLMADEPGSGKWDRRDRIERTWSELRGFSMDRNVLLVTATQVNRAGWRARTITADHISEDKRKLDHVSGMVAINAQDREERQEGIRRLNWIKLRHQGFNAWRCCWVADCLPLACPSAAAAYPDWDEQKKLFKE